MLAKDTYKAEAVTAHVDEVRRWEAVRVRVAKPHVRLDGTVLARSAVEILRRGADRG